MKLYTDTDRYGGIPSFPLVEAVNNQMRDLVRRKFAESGDSWVDFVFGSADRLITKEDIQEIERKILDTGYRFTSTSTASLRDAPDIYHPVVGFGEDLASFSFDHPEAVTAAPDDEGREQRGVGDNVVRHPGDVTGTARYVRNSERVLDFIRNGVPADTIAIIDDSGGTLTAPILEHFKGVICAGGTVRSHLGILTREYGIPCLMNAKLSGIQDGDKVQIEVSATAKSAEDYQRGTELTARIWRLTR